MKVNNYGYLVGYLIIVAIVLLQFAWYYVTLPGSKLSPDKEQEQPKLKSAAISYLIYVTPMVIGIYYLNSKQWKLM